MKFLETQTPTKLRGGYYTPPGVAAFLASWAIQDETQQVLEPSAGDGEVVSAAVQCLPKSGRVTAVELYADEAEKVIERGGSCTTVIKGDFFAWFAQNRPIGIVDAVVGNPPFIRYQQFPEEQRQVAFMLMREEGLHPSRLTNAWLPFVAVATRALRPGGRLALVLPAELLQVKYAAELREYLTRKYSHLIIVTFRRLLFPGNQEEVILLLGVRADSASAQIKTLELDGPQALCLEQVLANGTVKADLDHVREKWTQYYLSPSELGLIRELEKADSLVRLGDLVDVDVGVVTGQNDFFILSKEEACTRGVFDWCLPLVGRSAQIPGLVIRIDEWNRLAEADGKCYLLQLGSMERRALPGRALDYVVFGETQRIHEGYKCRIRLPKWWNVPSVWAPDAFLLRQIHDGPRIIHNPGGLVCTDTIHRLRAKRELDISWLAAASMNSLTFAFAELKGRSYGGGVLELEPTEAEALPFPKPGTPLDLDQVDNIVRRGELAETLNHVDNLVLKPAGLSCTDIAMLRGIWYKLYLRRVQRKLR